MKKIWIFLLAMILSLRLSSQVTYTAETPVKSICLQKEIIPPYLTVVDNSVIFSDADGNDIINAQETCSIAVTIRNEGKGNAYGCVAKVSGEGNTDGLTYTDCSLPTIKAGESYTLTIPIQASLYTTSGQVRFRIQVDEPNGFGTDPVLLTIDTHKFDAPMIEIVSYKISSDGSSQLRKKRPFKLQVLLQNTDQGEAKDVTCSFTVPENMFLLDGSRYQSFPSLLPNEKKLLEFELQSNANVPDQLEIAFKLSESYGKYAKDASVPLHFGQAISSGMVDIQVAGKSREEVKITKGSLVSDVDCDIPVTSDKNPNTFVLIIANEHYQRVAGVPFALNDGAIFREYCIKTLGVSEKHIRYLPDATYNQIKSEVNWLSNITEAWDNPQLIVYYAGHGIPDEASKTAYLLPVDGSGTDVTTGYKLDDLYAALGSMPASQITVFMDACFSGSKREDGMLASARGVALKTKSGVPQGKMVVFSAAQGDETAYPFREQQHGLFTYHLLKKLQATAGNVTLQALGDYIITEVKKSSLEENNKKQTPCVTPSAAVASVWKTWTLK